MDTLGTESLLGDSYDLDAQTMRDNLALATRYLANWYKATDSSIAKDLNRTAPDTAVWWQKIDVVRRKVEATYQELLAPSQQLFASAQSKADYNDASAAWAALYREMVLSVDTIDVSLLDVAGSYVDTLTTAPAMIVTQVGNQIGKAVGGGLGSFLALTWPYLIGAGVLLGVYTFRVPLAALARKAAA
jgi:hypothetical protein